MCLGFGRFPIETAIVLLSLATALVVWMVTASWRSPYTPVQSVIYFVNVLLTRVLWRVEIDGQFPIGNDTGAVVVCNHRCSVDPFFIQLTPGRLVHWFVAKEYFGIPIVGWFLRSSGAIPTNRGGIDTASTRRAIRHAQAGGLVGMFPEARINATDQFLLPGRAGAALVAIKAGVPIVPCYIKDAPYDGTFWGCLFMAAKVRLTLGDPLDLTAYTAGDTSRDVLQDITKTILRAIASLGGDDNFCPELAGPMQRRSSSTRKSEEV